MNSLLRALLTDGKVIIYEEDLKPIQKKLKRIKLIEDQHYLLIFLPGEKVLIELIPEEMEKWLK